MKENIENIVQDFICIDAPPNVSGDLNSVAGSVIQLYFHKCDSKVRSTCKTDA